VEEVAKAIGMSSSFYNTFEEENIFELHYKIVETFKTLCIVCRWFRFAQLAKGKKFRP
jgi:hypothetical protein